MRKVPIKSARDRCAFNVALRNENISDGNLQEILLCVAERWIF